MPLFDGRDEPLGRVDLALDKLDRLTVLLLHATVRADHVADHIHIAAVDLHFGDVVGVERELEMAVLVVENEVGNDIGCRVGPALGIEVSGFGRQAPDLGDRIAELLLGDLQTGDQLLVVLLDEFVEIAGQDLAGQPPGARIDLHLVHLQQQALAQVTGPDPRGFEFVDDVQQPLKLADRGLDADREGDVVGDRLQVTPQVAVLVDAADQIDRQLHVSLRKVAVAELLDEGFLQRTSLGQVDGALFVVFRVVVDTTLVGRRIVFTQVLVHGDLLGLLVLLRRTLLLFECDVLLDLLLDTLFELHGGQFKQLDHLDLLRGEFLLKGKDLFLINSHIGSKLTKSERTRRP